MQQVKIIKGTYGHRPEATRRIKPVSAGGLVSLPDDEAERLMHLGVAEPVSPHSREDCEDVATLHYGQIEGEPAIGIGAEMFFGEAVEAGAESVGASIPDPEQLKQLTNAELRAMAENMGISTAKLRNKAELIDAIISAEVTPEPEDNATENGDKLPELCAEAPVT